MRWCRRAGTRPGCFPAFRRWLHDARGIVTVGRPRRAHREVGQRRGEDHGADEQRREGAKRDAPASTWIAAAGERRRQAPRRPVSATYARRTIQANSTARKTPPRRKRPRTPRIAHPRRSRGGHRGADDGAISARARVSHLVAIGKRTASASHAASGKAGRLRWSSCGARFPRMPGTGSTFSKTTSGRTCSQLRVFRASTTERAATATPATPGRWRTRGRWQVVVDVAGQQGPVRHR